MGNAFTGLCIGMALGMFAANSFFSAVKAEWRNEAVKNGHAEYRVNKTGTVTFEWKVQADDATRNDDR